jgi:hypothetical protein
MPGLFTTIKLSVELDRFAENLDKNNVQFPHLRTEILFEDAGSSSSIFIHAEYPRVTWLINGFKVLVLGKIYNKNIDGVRNDLYQIINHYLHSDWELFRRAVSAFVNHADGDFIVQIYKDSNNFFVFNDFLGRLPLYYRLTSGYLMLASELKHLFLSGEEVVIEKSSLCEYLLYEYNIDNSTLYQGFSKFGGGALLAVVNGSLSHTALNLDTLEYKGEIDNFDAQLIKSLKEITEERVNNFQDSHDLRSDISGGLDSRIIAYLLRQFRNISYQTFQYTQDESLIAREVLKCIAEGEDVKFNRYEHNYINDKTDYAASVWLNDGLVNYWSNTICHFDLFASFEKSNIPYVRFTGLGISDFIRKYPHSFAPILDLSIGKYHKYGLHQNIDDLIKFTGANKDAIQKKWQDYLNKFDFKNISYHESLRYLYLDFQKNMVMLSSEERERIFCWTVPIMFSSRLVKYVFNHFNPSSAGYFPFINLLNSLDKRLAKIPLYGRRVSFTNITLALLYDVFNRIRNLKSKYFNRFFRIRIAQVDSVGARLTDKMQGYRSFSRLSVNQELLGNLTESQLMRLETLLIYFDFLHDKLDVSIKLE